MDFSIAELMDEGACYGWLVARLHPGGLRCPRCGAREGLNVHRRDRDPVLDYRCCGTAGPSGSPGCGRVFNAFTGTAFHGTHRRPSELVLVLRGVSQGVSTAQLARELDRHRGTLLNLRHVLQSNALSASADHPPLADAVVEADEMYQNAGGKRGAAHRPQGPAATAGQ